MFIKKFTSIKWNGAYRLANKPPHVLIIIKLLYIFFE